MNISELVEAIEQKLEFRGKKLNDVKEGFLRKEARLERLWGKRLSSQMSILPEFNQVYREVKRELRQTISL
ncbi:hypothetical protein CEE39_03280 [bacterium (candidate division B38) B3_B38]|nr:MAG: hypothetical protein CEE39_03280 [bacterium (candidate division B38) B3_B38]